MNKQQDQKKIYEGKGPDVQLLNVIMKKEREIFIEF